MARQGIEQAQLTPQVQPAHLAEEQNIKGQLGYVGETSTGTFRAASDEFLGELFKSASARDEEGISQAISEGSAFEVDAGTHIRAIDRAPHGGRVQFVSDPFGDQAGWIADSAS